MQNLHCLDTSFFINSWRKYYPHRVFPTFWQKLDRLIRQRIVISCREVYAEIEQKDDDLLAWATERRHIFEDAEDETVTQMLLIMSKFPNFAAQGSSKNAADPWTIAHAIARRAIVVSDEQPLVGMQKDTKPPKIPNVCAELGIQCLGIVDFLAAVGMEF